MPGWICGRLASIYRTLKRYDDEVMLLERYRESQTTEEARTRFDARLSKARAIADRKRRAADRRARDSAPGAPALEGAAARLDARGRTGERRDRDGR